MTAPGGELPEASHNVRQVTLLSEEVVVALLSPEEGIVDHSPEKGSLLALTNKRVIAFLDAEERKETRVAPLEKVDSVSIYTHGRNFKPLYQGISLGMAGFLVYLLVGTFSTGVPFSAGVSIATFLGGAIVFLGLLFIVRFFTWEQGGELVFRMGVLEMSFPYNSNKAAPDAYEVMHRCFQLQAGEDISPIQPASARIEEIEEPALATVDDDEETTPSPAHSMEEDHVVEDALIDADSQATPSEEPAPDTVAQVMETLPLDEAIQGSEKDQPQGPGYLPDHGSDESRRTPPP